MLFEHIFWEEEYLGLISGVSFVLMGVFAYFLYTLAAAVTVLLFIIAAVGASGLTAILFQVYRVKKIKPGVSTFAGGITLGIAVLFWALSTASVTGNIVRKAEISGISAALTALSFFAFGFLFLALHPLQRYPPEQGYGERKIESRGEGKKEKKDIEDFIDRL